MKNANNPSYPSEDGNGNVKERRESSQRDQIPVWSRWTISGGFQVFVCGMVV
jgi:hypothetical protein